MLEYVKRQWFRLQVWLGWKTLPPPIADRRWLFNDNDPKFTLTIEEYSKRYIEPAMRQRAEQIDAQLRAGSGSKTE